MYSQLPMYQRIGQAAYKANLDNTLAICKLLGNPENKFKSIHIAGTNGKGSTSHMLAAILQQAGYKVGLYTSPHLKDFRERIRINGKMIPRPTVVAFIEKHSKAFEQIKPSFFEMTVGLAFDYFAKQQVDIAIIETGLGGRLDSTNVITPLLSIITNISFDHQNLLGNTLPKIASEKAGIIKKEVPVIIGETQSQVAGIFTKKATQTSSPFIFADQSYTTTNYRQIHKKGKLYLQADLYERKTPGKKQKKITITCELPGSYQLKNITTVWCAAQTLHWLGYKVSQNAILQGIANVSTLTGLKGRWQVIGQKPLVITDTGHNAAGIDEVIRQIDLTPHKKLHIVLGVVNDKDITAILKKLPKNATYYFTRPAIPRGLEAQQLQAAATKYNLQGIVYPTVRKALNAAKKAAKSNDLIFVGGSTFVAAEVV